MQWWHGPIIIRIPMRFCRGKMLVHRWKGMNAAAGRKHGTIRRALIAILVLERPWNLILIRRVETWVSIWEGRRGCQGWPRRTGWPGTRRRRHVWRHGRRRFRVSMMRPNELGWTSRAGRERSLGECPMERRTGARRTTRSPCCDRPTAQGKRMAESGEGCLRFAEATLTRG